MASIEIYSELPSGLKTEVGRAETLRLSSMGSTIPTVSWGGTFIEVAGKGGPLHAVFGNYKKPAPPPISSPSPPKIGPNPLVEIQGLKAVVYCLVRMMGGSVTIQPHELTHSMGDKLTTVNQQDPAMVILIAEE